jgi:hypothetical protein
MTNRCIVSAGVLVALISAGAVAAVSGAAQRSAMAATTKAAAKSWTPSRMPDGQPDLQGVWDFRTITPLERQLTGSRAEARSVCQGVGAGIRNLASAVRNVPWTTFALRGDREGVQQWRR